MEFPRPISVAAPLLVAMVWPGPSIADSEEWLVTAPRLTLGDARPDTPRQTETLEGSVLVYHVLVNQPGASWSSFDTRQVAERVQDGLGFVTAQAQAYGVTVGWTQEWKFVSLDVKLTNVRSDTSWTDQVIQAATGSPRAALLAQLTARKGIDRAVIAIHLNASGRSFCLPWTQELVVFNRTAPVYWEGGALTLGAQTHAYSRPAVYAHELLHAFGAEDLYEPEERAERARRCSPNDIMLTGHAELDTLSVGKHTATTLGWRTSGPRDCFLLESPACPTAL